MKIRLKGGPLDGQKYRVTIVFEFYDFRDSNENIVRYRYDRGNPHNSIHHKFFTFEAIQDQPCKA